MSYNSRIVVMDVTDTVGCRLLLLPTEVPTARLREPTVSWTLFWSYVTAIVTTFAVPQLTGGNVNLGAKTDFIFGGCMIITLVLTYWYLPETRGRSMVEIDEMYRLDIPPRRWRSELRSTLYQRQADHLYCYRRLQV